MSSKSSASSFEKETRALVEELTTESDRGVALVCGAILEKELASRSKRGQALWFVVDGRSMESGLYWFNFPFPF
jgi:hypothetical protein